MRISKLVLAAFLVIFSGCGSLKDGGYSVTGLGSSDGDAAIAFGKIVSEQAEVGVSAVFYAVEDDHYTPSFGPYAAYLIPMPADVAEDWQPFTGAALLMETEDFGWIPKAFGGVIYKPKDALAPYYMAEKAWPSDDISTPDISDRGDNIWHWFGLRLKF